MIASFNMHISYLSLYKGRDRDIDFWVVTIQLCLFLLSLKMILFTTNLLITFITLAHRVWCDHLTNDTNTTIQKIYPTVCVCVCVCVFALITYVGMYKCMNIQ